MVLVAGVVGAIVMMATLKMQASSQRAQGQLESRDELRQILLKVELVLQNPAYCAEHFKDIAFNPTLSQLATVSVSQNSSGQPLFIHAPGNPSQIILDKDKKLGGGSQVSKILLENFIFTGGTNYVADLEVRGKHGTGAEFQRVLTLQIATAAVSATSQKIVSCSVLNSASENAGVIKQTNGYYTSQCGFSGSGGAAGCTTGQEISVRGKPVFVQVQDVMNHQNHIFYKSSGMVGSSGWESYLVNVDGTCASGGGAMAISFPVWRVLIPPMSPTQIRDLAENTPHCGSPPNSIKFTNNSFIVRGATNYSNATYYDSPTNTTHDVPHTFYYLVYYE